MNNSKIFDEYRAWIFDTIFPEFNPVFRHNAWILFKEMFSILIGFFCLAILTQSETGRQLGSVFMNAFKFKDHVDYAAFVVMLIAWLFSTGAIASTAAQAIFVFQKYRVQKRQAWLIYVWVSILTYVTLLISAIFWKSVWPKQILTFIFFWGLLCVLLKWVFLCFENRILLKNLLSICVGTNSQIIDLTTRVTDELVLQPKRLRKLKDNLWALSIGHVKQIATGWSEVPWWLTFISYLPGIFYIFVNKIDFFMGLWKITIFGPAFVELIVLIPVSIFLLKHVLKGLEKVSSRIICFIAETK